MLTRQAVEAAKGRRTGRDTPARGGGIRFTGCLLFRPVAPAANNERSHTALARAKLKAARGIERKPRHFTNHGGERAALEPFFHGRKNVAVVPRLAKDHTIRMQAHAGKRRRKEIAPAQTPEHRSLQSRSDSGDE